MKNNKMKNIKIEITNYLKKSYQGHCLGGYGYGGIVDCALYIQDRYGEDAALISDNEIPMKSYIMSRFEKHNGKSVNNCTLTAITTVLNYYKSLGYDNIDSSIDKIYGRVQRCATQNRYTQKRGMGFHKIDNVVKTVLHEYGYQEAECRGCYIWTFDNHVKREIDMGNPVIMSIARGYYGNHTITVCGYRIYKYGERIRHMIKVYDGWSTSARFIDYEAFSLNIFHSGFGSFNIIRLSDTTNITST